jgi:hypothetical protein
VGHAQGLVDSPTIVPCCNTSKKRTVHIGFARHEVLVWPSKGNKQLLAELEEKGTPECVPLDLVEECRGMLAAPHDVLGPQLTEHLVGPTAQQSGLKEDLSAEATKAKRDTFRLPARSRDRSPAPKEFGVTRGNTLASPSASPGPKSFTGTRRFKTLVQFDARTFAPSHRSMIMSGILRVTSLVRSPLQDTLSHRYWRPIA